MSQSNDTFLKAIANSLYQIHGQQIAELTIVFPNRRSGLFFTEYLNRIITGPTFSPEIITIQDLFSNISKIRIEEQLPLILRLFKIYRNLSGTTETFDAFYLWGEMLLNDFDQVDKYLVDAELLFTNITDLKEIDQHFLDWNEERKEEIKQFWASQTGGDLKKDQKEFSQLWQILYPVYQKFREELFVGQIAYEGMLFRDVIENPECAESAYLKDNKFVIAGFNALNGCEKELFNRMNNKGIISFYWDYDLYYLNDKNQEAGMFMRENLALFPQMDLLCCTDNYNEQKQVHLYHTPSQIGQAQIAANEVANLVAGSAAFDETAIVLCDEELLLPVLSAIPRQIDNINVTMGLPLRQTPLFSLVKQLISLQKKSRREGEQYHFHYSNVVDILNNQLIQTIYPSECKSIVSLILRENLFYVSQKEIALNDLFVQVFSGNETIHELADYLLAIVYELFQYWEKFSGQNQGSCYQEYLFQVYLSMNKLKNTLLTAGQDIMGDKDFLNRETFFSLLLQYLNAVNVSYEGEPLAGLQIMGILETRTLDFKNIVLLSVNEGIMPKANTAGSFIPYHLRRGVGLPTTEEQNAMYAYYFYRLLQRAEHVTFIYNSGSNGLKTGEKSRFLHQLQVESPFQMEDQEIGFSIDPLPNYPISIEKTGKVVEALNQLLDSNRTISPTALDLYVQCPLSYYFKYIARFKEEEEVAEEVDARIFGQLFHAVMEAIYQPYLGMELDEKELDLVIENESNIEKALKEAFRIHFFKSGVDREENFLSGRNRLVFEVIRKMVLQTLKLDRSRVPFVIQGLEQKVSTTISLSNGAKTIRIGGVIDRIDSLSDATEIIDYKTGNTDHAVGDLAELFDHQAKKRNKAALQTLIYCCIYEHTNTGQLALFPAIYALKKVFKQEKFRLVKKGNSEEEINYRSVKNEFEPMLVNLLEELFDPATPFFQTTVEENCLFCSFASICGRNS